MNNSVANLVIDTSQYPKEIQYLIERLQRIANSYEKNYTDDNTREEGLLKGRNEIREYVGDILYLFNAEKSIFKKENEE